MAEYDRRVDAGLLRDDEHQRGMTTICGRSAQKIAMIPVALAGNEERAKDESVGLKNEKRIAKKERR